MTKASQETKTTVTPWNPTMSLPAAALQDAGLGNENVRTEDLTLPRLVLLQQMSPEVMPGSGDKYVEGAMPGLILNSLTNELFKAVYCANLDFSVEYTVWRKREQGGGLLGTFPTEQEAREFVAASTDVKPEHCDIVETHNHLLLLIDEEGKIKDPVLCQMTSSKLSVSRRWNSMPAIRKGARFGTIWALSSVAAKNKLGQPYFNFDIELAGYPDDALYTQIKDVYEALGLNKTTH
ncbi:TPA: hypothetical protein QB617_000211 [Pasteurella multocida]|nr:hypothetical protein [Pasteurella multocida]